jgi:hypothetical protein
MYTVNSYIEQKDEPSVHCARGAPASRTKGRLLMAQRPRLYFDWRFDKAPALGSEVLLRGIYRYGLERTELVWSKERKAMVRILHWLARCRTEHCNTFVRWNVPTQAKKTPRIPRYCPICVKRRKHFKTVGKIISTRKRRASHATS